MTSPYAYNSPQPPIVLDLDAFNPDLGHGEPAITGRVIQPTDSLCETVRTLSGCTPFTDGTKSDPIFDWLEIDDVNRLYIHARAIERALGRRLQNARDPDDYRFSVHKARKLIRDVRDYDRKLSELVTWIVNYNLTTDGSDTVQKAYDTTCKYMPDAPSTAEFLTQLCEVERRGYRMFGLPQAVVEFNLTH